MYTNEEKLAEELNPTGFTDSGNYSSGEYTTKRQEYEFKTQPTINTVLSNAIKPNIPFVSAALPPRPTPLFDDVARRDTARKVSYSSLDVGGNVIALNPGDDIQAAMDELYRIGGGTVQLGFGTYNQPTPLLGRSQVDLVGQDLSTTIIDFGTTASNLSFTGLNVYVTGSITSVTSGVVVTGSSAVNWTADMVQRHLFLGTRWYRIGAVTDTATLVLAEGFADTSLTFPGQAYRIADPVRDVIINNLTFQNSTTNGISLTDVRDLNLENLNFFTNGGSGMLLTNASHTRVTFMNAVQNTSHGYSFANCGLFNAEGLASASNGGNGININNALYFPLTGSASQYNTGDGINCTSLLNSSFLNVDASGNGGQGFEFVSGCNNNFLVACSANSNTSDGIKLTATSDNNTLGTALNLVSNGGYGINIAASTCDNNTIAVPYFSGNTSGTYNDSGTSTNIVATTADTLVFFGDASDGNVTISANTSLSRDMYYNNLTVDNTKVLTTSGYRIFVRGTLTNNGTVHWNGNAGNPGTAGNVEVDGSSTPATGGTGGAALTSGTLYGSKIGATGGIGGDAGSPGSVGNDGGSDSQITEGAGVAGGTSGVGDGLFGYQSRAGGAAGTVTTTADNPVKSVPFTLFDYNGRLRARTGSGAGGGGGCGYNGSGGSTTAGGGGGGGSGSNGGTVSIAAQIIINAGTISTLGGAGGNGGNGAGPATGNYYGGGGGGGGGGNGGLLVLIYKKLTNSGTISVTGGTGGTGGTKGGGAATNGSNGTTGADGLLVQYSTVG